MLRNNHYVKFWSRDPFIPIAGRPAIARPWVPSVGSGTGEVSRVGVLKKKKIWYKRAMSGAGEMRVRRERFEALTAPENAEQTMMALTEAIGRGRKTFNEVCEELDVSYTLFLMWLQGDEKRWGIFLKTHEARAVGLVDEALRIADNCEAVVVEVDGERVAMWPDVQRDRLRVDTRFKYAQHYAPGIFGKRVQHEHSAVGDWGERLRRARERVVSEEPAAVETERVENASAE